MPAPKAVLRFTANFAANLAQIASCWRERDARQAYVDLLDELGATVIGNLERHPRIGRRFLARAVHSLEGQAQLAALLKRFGAVEIREYLAGDYLLLYAVSAEGVAGKSASTIHLLSIKHHR